MPLPRFSTLPRLSLLAALVAAIQILVPEPAEASRCLFISSYHKGYAWSDGVERGLRSVLEGRCELRQFDMDTKRNKDPEHVNDAALDAKALIEQWQPSVVITADDNAAKYVIEPFYRDAETPFVFCGVNWTADEYGFPYSNVTGIIEVAPIRPILENAVAISGGHRAVYLGADTLTEKKNLSRFTKATEKMGITLEGVLSKTVAEWLESYRQAQSADFIILGSNSGITDWDSDTVKQELASSSTRLTVTNHGWMMPYAMFGLTKVPEEQGEWAAHVALEILSGTKPGDIPIVANRKWDMWANRPLLQVSSIKLPPRLEQKAKRIQRQ